MRHLFRALCCLVLLASIHTGEQPIERFHAWLRDHGGGDLQQADELRGQELAIERRNALRQLMRSDPRRAAALAMPRATLERMPPAIRQHLERRVAGVARLMVACEMPVDEVQGHEHGAKACDCRGTARMTRELRLGGERFEAFVYGDWQAAVSGDYQLADAIVLDGTAVLGAAPVQVAAAPPAGESPLIGALPTNQLAPRKVLYIIARFADEDGTVTVKSEVDAVNEMTTTSNFFRENTEDLMYFVADQGGTLGGTLMDIVRVQLPSNASVYTDAFPTLVNDARNRALALGFTYSNYNFDVVVTTNKAGFGYAGKAWVGSQGTHWRNDYSSLRTAGHELGHNLGLSHAYYWRTDATEPFGRDSRPGGYVGDTDMLESIEYGHYFSMMSAQYSGEMNDPTKPHFSPMEKSKLGWLPLGATAASDTQQVSTSGTYRVYRHDVKLQTGSPRGLRIEAPATIYTGATSYRYWLSYRYAPWSNGTGQGRAGLHVEAANGTAWPIQLDVTPYSNDDASGASWTDDNSDKVDATLVLGRTYSDAGGAIHITPVARNTNVAGDEYLDVVINLGSFAGNRPPAITSQTQSALTVPTGTTVNFAVTASDPDGDTLAYGWRFDPLNSHVESGLNSSTASASWSTAGQYKVRAMVSDMKGGQASHTFLVTVGAPANTGRIAGRVLWGGRPVANARLAIGTLGVWSDCDGGYLFSGLAAGSQTLTCRKDGLTFTAQFANPLTLAAGEYAVGKDWYANEAYPDSASAATYTVSGTATDNGAGMSGVVVTIGGKSATTSAGGAFTITGVPNGVWPVTAWAPNAVFNAVSATVSNANLTGVAVVRTRYTISGEVATAAAGVSVTVRAGTYSITGNSTKQGSNDRFAYSLNVPLGTYTLVASAAGYTFTPSGFANPVVVDRALTGRNFSYATPATRYCILGTVTVAGIPVSGVSLATSGANAVTGPDGGYALYVPAGSYTVTPSLSGGAFTPANRAVTVATADVTAQDFTLTDAAPTIATAAAASPSTVAVPTGSTTLTVLGADNSGEGTLTYTWDVTVGPYPVAFSANGTNAAKTSVATFQGAGTYTFRATIRDIRQQIATSTVNVTVQAPTGGTIVTVSPYRSEMIFGDSRLYTATGWNSVGSIVAITPVWSASGGTIDAGGLYQATAAGSTYTVTASASGGSGNAYVTVLGTPEPTVTVAASDAVASEPGLGLGGGTFTLTRNIGTGAISIAYTVTGTASAGSDYTALGGTIAMAAGVTTATIAVAPLDDALVEAHETVIVNLQPGTGYQVGAPSTATVTIKDDETPTIAVSVPDNAAAEPAATGTFRLTRSGNPDAALSVVLDRAGTATAVTDYGGVGTTASLASGATTVDLVLTPVDDAIAEDSETAILTVMSGSGYAVGSPASGTVTIADDEAPVLVVSATDVDCAEASSNDGVFTVTRLGSRAAALTVNYVLTGTAVNGTDYTSRTGTVTINANSGSNTVSIDPIDDAEYEGPETAIITLASGTGYTVGGAPTASITIVDNDKPTVSIAATDAEAVEGADTATFTISRTGITSLGSLAVNYTISGTATAAGDYQTLSGSATIPAGAAATTVTVTTIQDAITEVPETVIATLAADAAYTVATAPGNSATVTIFDDSETPLLTISATDATASEPAKGDGSGAFTITRAGSRTAALTVDLAITGTATAGSDYTSIAATLALPAGATTALITVAPLDDALAEPDETVVATLLAGTGYGVGSPGSATVNLYDDETPSIVPEVVDADCAEGATANPGSYRLRRLGLRTTALSVNIAMSGTATSGTDYTALATPVAISTNNATSSTFVLTPLNEALVEGTETAILTVTAGTGYAPGTPAAVQLDIKDDDVVTVNLSVPDANCGEPADNGSFRITRSAASASTLTVTYTVSGTAGNGSDYTALGGSATIASGATTVDIPVVVSNDALVEGTETVIVTLTLNGASYNIGTAAQTILLKDDDSPTITASATDSAAAEGGDTGTFTLTATPAPAANLAVAYTIGGTAANGTDYTTLSGTATILAGQTTTTVVVAPIDDALGEPAETATLTLAAGTGYNVGTATAQTVTIAASDTPVASIIASDPTAAEPSSTGRFTISLSNPASANTVVALTVAGSATGGTDYGSIAATLTVNAGQTAGSITVTPIDDALVEGSESVIVTLAAGSGYGIGSPSSATVDIADDETVGSQAILLSPASLSVPEGGTATFGVRLQADPAGTLVVAVAAGAGDTDISVSGGASLTFTSANWSTPQTVTLAAAPDADVANGQRTITASASGVPSVNLTATEADDDVQGYILSGTALSVPEGGTATFTVRLAYQPAATTAVTVARTAGDGDIAVTVGASLSFTTADWATPQTVTLAAGEDADLANGTATITISASGIANQTVTATEADNDVQALVLSTTSLNVPEGGTATFTVRLAFQPAASTTVAVARTAGDTDLTVSGGSSLTFTTANWATPQTVTLAAAQDADAANGTATITVSSGGITSQTLTASEVDDDTLAAVVSSTAVTVPEGGTATFTVRLGAMPAASVVLTVARVSGDTDLTVSGGASLTFTTANWATPQTVTLAAAEDADTANGAAAISVTGTGVTAATVTATESDNDSQGLVVSTGSLAVPEGGSATFTVRLLAAPSSNVAVTVSRTAGDGDITVSGGAALTFTTANWATPQTVTLAAAEDADATNGTATITVAAATLSDVVVAASEVDNDAQSLTVSTTTVTVPEGGTATFTVRLAAQPAGNVTVTTSYTAGDADITVSGGASLTFTTTDWMTPQTVTLAAAADADTANGVATISVASAGLSTVTVAASEADDDVQALVASTASLSVPEGGTATFTVRLAFQPASNTTVAVARASGDADIGVSGGSSLTFTTANWATPQTVTLAAAQDVDTANGTANIAVSSAGLVTQTVAASEVDDDVQALVASTASLSVPEGGTATFTVRLAFQPAANATVTVARTSGDADITVSGGASLTFTTANWMTPQTVTLAAAEDADAANGSATITVSSVGLTDLTVAATEADNDVQGLTVSTTALTVPEAGTATFTVRLAAQPAADVVVAVARTAGDADITVSGGASLTFTTANWAIQQTVTLAAAADADTANGTATISISSAGLTTRTVTATEADDDVQALVVSNTAVTVPEGATATFTVRLTAQPAANVTVTVARTAGDADIAVTGGASLTFTTVNWATPQTVTLMAAQDDDVADSPATISVSASGLTTMTVTATEDDDDTQAVVVSTAALSVPEAGTATFTVRLAYRPAAGTTVTVSRTSGDTDLSVSGGASLTFTAADWSTGKTVTLAAAADADSANGTAQFTVASVGLTSATVDATEIDDDTLGMLVSASAVTVPEGGSATFTVRLSAAPAATTTVTVTRSGDADILVSGGASLSFTTGDWATPQTVTLTALQDADTSDGSATLTLASAGLPDVTVTATEADDDAVEIVASVAAITVPEGGTAAFNVSLAAQPAATVTVLVARASGDSDITVQAGAALTFTTADWNIGQTVTLAAAEDADLADGQAIIALSASGLPTVQVVATEGDDDVQALVLSSATATVPEGGTAVVGVSLAFQPAASVTVAVARTSGDSDITVISGATLTFTTANWATPQDVVLAAAQDADLADGVAVITASSAAAPDQTVTASEDDDDLQALTVSTAALTVPEGGTASFTVRLAFQPAADTAVAVAWTSGDGDLSVAGGAALTFTSSDWATPQTVTIAAAQDADAVNGSAVFSITSAGLTTATVTASETDDDVAAAVLSTATLGVPEGGTASFTVTLSYQPAAPVVVTVARTAGDSDITVQSGGSLVFTDTDWNVPQTVTLAAAEDADAVAGSATISATGSGLQTTVLTANEIENDSQALVVSQNIIFVAEGGSLNFTIRLAAQPTADVTVTTTRIAGDADLTAGTGATLVFTTANWATPQTVTINAAQDVDMVNGTATFRIAASGLADVDVAASEVDDDSQSLVVSTTALTVPEASSASFTVRLAYQPVADTTVTATWTSGDADLSVASGATLVFTTANWATPQQVGIAAAADVDTTNGSAVFTVASPSLASIPVTATELDDDVVNLLVSTATLNVPEGATAAFSVVLTMMPAGDLAVAVARTIGDTDLTVQSGSVLLFTTADWNVPRNVVIAAAADADALDGGATFTVSASGVASQTVAASEIDDDAAGLVTSVTRLKVPENGMAGFTVRLAAQPPGDTTVLVTHASGDADISVAGGASLFFTTANWDTPQQSVLAAADDLDLANGSALVNVEAGGLGPALVMADESDDDAAQGISVGSSENPGGSCGAGGLGLLLGLAGLGLAGMRRRVRGAGR